MRLPSYPLYDRWLNEERVGRHVADLIQITDPTLLSAAAKQGFIANYTPAGGAQIDPEPEGRRRLVRADARLHGHRLQCARRSRRTRRSSSTTPAGTRWPIRAGRAASAPRRRPPAAAATRSATCSCTTLKDQYGETWFRKLAANKPDIYASKAPLFERLAAGEYAIMDQGSQGTLTDLYLKGAPVRWVFPAPTPVAVTVQSISAHAPHPNAARLFQEWSVTAEAEALWISLVAAGASRARRGRSAQARRTRTGSRESWYADPDRALHGIPERPGLRRSEEADHRASGTTSSAIRAAAKASARGRGRRGRLGARPALARRRAASARATALPAAIGLLLVVLVLVPIAFMFVGAVLSGGLADPDTHLTLRQARARSMPRCPTCALSPRRSRSPCSSARSATVAGVLLAWLIARTDLPAKGADGRRASSRRCSSRPSSARSRG